MAQSNHPPRPRLIGEAPSIIIGLERIRMMMRLYRPRLRAMLDRAALLPKGGLALYQLRSGDSMATVVARTNSYDIRTLNEVWGGRVYDRWLIRPLTNDSVVVDLGANCGYFSVLAKSLGAARIVAVEPHPENAGILRANSAINACDVHVVEGAATADAERTRLSLTVSRNPRLHSLSIRDRHEVGTLEVEGIPINEVLGLAEGRIELFKIDIEGGEWDVLRAVDDWHVARTDLIVVEADDEPPHDLVDRLVENGFSFESDPPYYAFRRANT